MRRIGYKRTSTVGFKQWDGSGGHKHHLLLEKRVHSSKGGVVVQCQVVVSKGTPCLGAFE